MDRRDGNKNSTLYLASSSRLGLPTPTPAQLQAVLQQRRAAQEHIRALRLRSDMNRTEVEYSPYALASVNWDEESEDRGERDHAPGGEDHKDKMERLPMTSGEHAPHEFTVFDNPAEYRSAPAMTDAEGRTVLLQPLRMLLYLTLTQCRLRRRLHELPMFRAHALDEQSPNGKLSSSGMRAADTQSPDSPSLAALHIVPHPMSYVRSTAPNPLLSLDDDDTDAAASDAGDVSDGEVQATTSHTAVTSRTGAAEYAAPTKTTTRHGGSTPARENDDDPGVDSKTFTQLQQKRQRQQQLQQQVQSTPRETTVGPRGSATTCAAVNALLEPISLFAQPHLRQPRDLHEGLVYRWRGYSMLPMPPFCPDVRREAAAEQETLYGRQAHRGEAVYMDVTGNPLHRTTNDVRAIDEATVEETMTHIPDLLQRTLWLHASEHQAIIAAAGTCSTMSASRDEAPLRSFQVGPGRMYDAHDSRYRETTTATLPAGYREFVDQTCDRVAQSSGVQEDDDVSSTVLRSTAALASLPATMMSACAEDSLSDSEADTEDNAACVMRSTKRCGQSATTESTANGNDPSWLPAVGDANAVPVKCAAASSETCILPMSDLNSFLRQHT